MPPPDNKRHINPLFLVIAVLVTFVIIGLILHDNVISDEPAASDVPEYHTEETITPDSSSDTDEIDASDSDVFSIEEPYEWTREPTIYITADWTLDEDGVLTISGSGAMYDYIFDITPWYEKRAEIKQIVVQDGITRIGDGAFRHCFNATKAVIPQSVTEIGRDVFTFCDSLQDIEINSGNKAYCMVDRVLFSRDKTKLVVYLPTNTASQYIVPTSVTEIMPYAFAYSAISSVNLPSGLKTIGDSAFTHSAISSIDLPTGLAHIGFSAFAYCNNLTSVRIPEGVKDLPFLVFNSCENLSSVYLPESITMIDYWAFELSGLTDIYFAGSRQQWEAVLHSDYFSRFAVHFNAW